MAKKVNSTTKPVLPKVDKTKVEKYSNGAKIEKRSKD